MRRLSHLVVAVLTVAGLAISAPAGRAASDGSLDMYRLTAPAPVMGRLIRAGFDVAATRPSAGGLEADLVLSPAQADGLGAAGLSLAPWRNAEGKGALELARQQAADGYDVWRSYDQPGGLRDELADLARRHPDLVELQVIGHSVEGREIVALRLTRNPQRTPPGTRPAVLHLSLQHAREWISGEVNRRLLRGYLDADGTDPEITDLLATRELWFVLVANPDGYQRTFEENRLWRKNTADNDGDGKITGADGVDLNRNFPDHFGYDPEGSSPRIDSPNYRGLGPASEPETQAIAGLVERVPFAFVVNYHSYGRLLLYPFGWQEQTPSADQPVYETLAGSPTNPAIPGYRPQLSTELYTTNGETVSWAHATHGALGFTLELGEGLPGNGFLFPDNEALVRQEFEINRPFALDLARSAPEPGQPRSHLGNTAPHFVIDPFPVSYGDPQPVQATVARHLGEVSLNYRVNGGPARSAPTAEWTGGARFGGPGDVHYRVVRGMVAGTSPGDRVEVWFEGSSEHSAKFTYVAKTESNAPVLVVAGGDHARRSGPLLPPGQALPHPLPGDDGHGFPLPVPLPLPGGTPADPAAPTRLTPVVEALAANGVATDVYDAEAQGHLAPHPLGVLRHYAAVVWTVDEFRGAGIPGTVSRLANEEMLTLRAYLNEGGRLLYTGREAGRPYAQGDEYDSRADGPCNPEDRGEDGCTPLSDDFFQYWLGAYDHFDGGGGGPEGIPRVDGVDVPFADLSWTFAGPGVAPGRSAASFVAISDALGEGAYPHLGGRASARYRRAAGAVMPNAAAVTTAGGILFGFGFEDIAEPDERAAVMARVLGYLLPAG